MIYLAGPISKGDVQANVARADAAHYELLIWGFAVVNPMLTCWAGWTAASDTGPSPYAHGAFRQVPYTEWIRCGIAIACRCDAVLRLPGESVGATAECAAAEECGVPVFTSVADLIAWRDKQ